MKTSDLIGDALDYAVDIARGFTFRRGIPEGYISVDPECQTAVWRRSPSGERAGRWACMRCYERDQTSRDHDLWGRLIEDEKIDLHYIGSSWQASFYEPKWHSQTFTQFGPTPGIAVARCFVASKLGDEVDIPKELL